MPKVNIDTHDNKVVFDNREKIIALLREKVYLHEFSFDGWDDILGSPNEKITEEEADKIFSKLKSPLSDDVIKDRGES